MNSYTPTPEDTPEMAAFLKEEEARIARITEMFRKEEEAHQARYPEPLRTQVWFTREAAERWMTLNDEETAEASLFVGNLVQSVLLCQDPNINPAYPQPAENTGFKAWGEVDLVDEETQHEWDTDPTHQQIANGHYWKADDPRYQDEDRHSYGADDGPTTGAKFHVKGLAFYLCSEDESPSPVYRKSPQAPEEPNSFQLWI